MSDPQALAVLLDLFRGFEHARLAIACGIGTDAELLTDGCDLTAALFNQVCPAEHRVDPLVRLLTSAARAIPPFDIPSFAPRLLQHVQLEGWGAENHMQRCRMSQELQMVASWVRELGAVLRRRCVGPTRQSDFPRDWRAVAAESLSRLPLATEAEKHSVANLIVEALTMIAGPTGIVVSRVHVTSAVRAGAPEPLLASRVLPGVVVDFQINAESQWLLRRRHSASADDAYPRRGVLLATDALRDCCHGAVLLNTLREQGSLGIVLCQRTIDRGLRQRLAKAGVMTVERLSIRHINRVAGALGCDARPLDSTQQTTVQIAHNGLVTPMVHGGCHSMWIRAAAGSEVGGEAQASSPRAVTVSLSVASRSVAASAERIVKAAVDSTADLLARPFISPARFLPKVLHDYVVARHALSACGGVSAAPLRMLTDCLSRALMPDECHAARIEINRCQCELNTFALAAVAADTTAAGCALRDADSAHPALLGVPSWDDLGACRRVCKPCADSATVAVTPVLDAIADSLGVASQAIRVLHVAV